MHARQLSKPGLDVAKAVIRTGGFQVFYHACGRPDLSEDGDPDNHIRAHHRVREHIGAHNNIEQGCRLAFAGGNIGIPGFPRDVAGFGILLEHHWRVSYYEEKKKGGWTGLWGLLDKGRIPKPYMKKEADIPFKIGEVLTLDQDGEAAFLRMVLRLRHAIEHSCGGGKDMQPTLTLVGGKPVISAVVRHLRAEPEDYYPMVRAILPPDRFPKINSIILSGIEPGDGLMLVSGPKVRELVRTNRQYADIYHDRAMLEAVLEASKI